MQSKVIGITSVVPQNGAKYTAINLGYFLKKRYKKSEVLILDFDFKFPIATFEELDTIELNIDKLASSSVSLTCKTLKEYVVTLKLGIDILKGSSLSSPSFFKEEFLSALINVAKETYDYVLIVFSSTEVDSGTVVTLLNANQVSVVVKNNKINELMAIRATRNIRLFFPDTYPVYAVFNMKNHYSKKNAINLVQKENVKIKGVLEYQPHTIDTQNLQQKSNFRRKSANDKFFKKWAKEIKEV